MTGSADDPKPRRRPRLSDVAQLAGVSLGAASKAISSPDAVRPRTRLAVERAVKELNYMPSEAGRALASRSTRMIGVAMPTLHHPVYASFFHALQNTLAERGYLTVALAHDFDREREIVLIERLVRRGVDALVLIGTDHAARTIALLDRVGLPYLYSWSSDEALERGAVGFSNRMAMHELVCHLAGLGHRRIAMITGEVRYNERARLRLKGVQEAAASKAMELVEVATAPLTITGGLDGYRRLDPVRKGVTALVCGTDLMAAGALHGARQDGFSAPEHLSVTGFDDIELAGVLTPPLTTVRAPIAEMAHATGEAIMAMLKSGEAVPTQVLPTALVVRASTGPAPAEPHATVTSFVSR
jgi:LacI family transcriptional regulator